MRYPARLPDGGLAKVVTGCLSAVYKCKMGGGGGGKMPLFGISTAATGLSSVVRRGDFKRKKRKERLGMQSSAKVVFFASMSRYMVPDKSD